MPIFTSYTIPAAALGFFLFMAACVVPAQSRREGGASSKLQLLWSDEFNYAGLPDSSKWSYDLGDGCPAICGWGNNELQYYTEKRAKNARVENGRLIIEAHREKTGTRDYSSVRLVSRSKGDWRYGRIEVRAKLPAGVGTWPAIWMLPTDWKYGGWPASGEIDIMEHVGYLPDSVFGSVHTAAFNHIIGTQSTQGIYLADCEKNYHVYGIDWSPDYVEFLVDGQAYHRFVNRQTGPDAWPFDQYFHLILNLAVGGNWGGKMGVREDIWPQRMEVDWVRVYGGR
jgi:beta-glucanase (GH16 family)